jgi:hypothetical protein
MHCSAFHENNENYADQEIKEFAISSKTPKGGNTSKYSAGSIYTKHLLFGIYMEYLGSWSKCDS